MRPRSFMINTWDDVLFFHWVVPQNVLRACVPEPLAIDTMEGQAWVTIVPFAMRNIRMRGFPRVPMAHALLECNVRTYVTYGGVPGVWFMRLDANHALAVWFGRTIASLPYAYAHIEQHRTDDALRYVCGSKQFDATATAQGPFKHAVVGSLDHWLCERYFLYTCRGKTLYRGRVIHPPWCLREAQSTIGYNTLLQRHIGWTPSEAPRVHWASRVDVQLCTYVACRDTRQP